MGSLKLKIVLKDDRRYYTYGDVISGTVVVSVSDKADIRDIIVKFEGTSITKNHRTVQRTDGQGQTRSEDRYVMIPINLIEIPLKLFPPPDIQHVLSSDEHTLTTGSYYYDFSIKIPDESSGFRLPPSFCHHALEDFATIEYAVVGVAHKTSGFSRTKSDFEKVNFHPSGTGLKIDSSHVLNRDGFLLPSFNTSLTRLKFEPIESTQRNFFKRLVSHKCIKIPFEYGMSFKSGESIQTEKGGTERIIQMGANLKNQISIFLGIPITPEAFRGLFFENFADSKKEAHPDQAKIYITHINISLKSYVNYTAAVTAYDLHSQWTLRDEDCDYQLDLNDFTPADYHGEGDAFRKISSKIEHLASRENFHMLELPEQFFDCEIPDNLTQSFCAQNIDYNHVLSINLKVKIYPGDRTDKFYLSSNIILTNTNSEPAPPSYQPK
ncbi:hypothetical protein HYPBUDRAFT_151835 [Hyphopichia burtonii NRRL Y-1933]|uniref:Arrestin-like N-terminal domain-containing protein n=1 Tax=Hyphopichia burtonii NRRL Y-1933 TaxID=984485 RepID=A0A1E4RMI3_9ASCO|nr:hypothetical protein HYPBUDRAFT_151835 [Hyphopichia burtonii NRRL Y-1933]ODV68305.1 hypothetical protein HYPBUDRAFT_151835 [Hyphopichia burtonii NRRL Y-1933]